MINEIIMRFPYYMKVKFTIFAKIVNYLREDSALPSRR